MKRASGLNNRQARIGTFVAAAMLIGLGVTVWSRFKTPAELQAADFRIPADPKFVLNSFGVICFGLGGQDSRLRLRDG